MGRGFVLLVWLIVGTFVAGMGAAGLGAITAIFTNGVKTGRRRVILAATFFPIACLAWAGAVFVFQWVINESVLHRDPGLGDMAKCPLPNGYSLLIIDTNGAVYNPRTQEVAVDYVQTLHVAGRYILGGRYAPDSGQLERAPDKADSYFLLDTTTGKCEYFANYQDLGSTASRLRVQPNLHPIAEVYFKYRYTAFDLFAGLLLCVPPVVSGWFLIRWIRRLRKTQELISAQA